MRVQTDNGLADMLFIGGVFFAALLVVRLVYGLVRRKPIRFTLISLGAVLGLYALALVLAGRMTSENVVPVGTLKCSDEWCVTVEGAVAAKSVGKAVSTGQFVVVTVRMSSEARGQTQKGSSPQIELITEGNRRYAPSVAAQRALETIAGKQPPLSSQVQPGGQVTTLQAFDIPGNARDLRVFVGERPWITRVILFNENSFFAGQTVFRVTPEFRKSL